MEMKPRSKCRLETRTKPAILGGMEQDAVLSEALALPEKDRAEVIVKLIESLGAPASGMSDEEAIAEAERRSEEMDRDPSYSISHEEFLRVFEDRKK